MGNAFPELWVRTMEVLQDGVPHKDVATVQALVEAAYGVPFSDVFAAFDPQPLGAASIGQVHRATLTPAAEATVQAAAQAAAAAGTGDIASRFAAESFRRDAVDVSAVGGGSKSGSGSSSSGSSWLSWLWGSSSSSSAPTPAAAHPSADPGGRDVVVKVQYPEVEGRFRGDVRTILWFCRVAQPEHVKALEEIEKQFRTEFDYRLEAANLADVSPPKRRDKESARAHTPQ